MNGAENSEGLSEAKINLKIALKLQNILESSGAVVLLTRSDDNGIYDLDTNTISQKKVSDIKNRVKIGNKSSADIFVSIHLNKIPQGEYWGWQTFFNSNGNSKKLATCIQNNLNETISLSNKRVPHKLDNVYIMKHVEIPISIVECGFLSNSQESKKLLEDNYQDKLAWGIYSGIMDYFYN
ncbi:MAG: N-acetylmuramoyl-L-alanine amidase [Clostridia bacterium]|nr:N-acetylmuramoyl-L-alanine amidase [Clostridia bacterium]